VVPQHFAYFFQIQVTPHTLASRSFATAEKQLEYRDFKSICLVEEGWKWLRKPLFFALKLCNQTLFLPAPTNYDPLFYRSLNWVCPQKFSPWITSTIELQKVVFDN